jgi:hypothetical protein
VHVVAAESLLVIAVDVVQAPNDNQQIAPMLEKVDALPEQLGRLNLQVPANFFFDIYPDSSKTREKFLVFFGLADSARGMIRGGFLTEEDRGKLVALVRDGSAASRVTRRANALVLLDGGWSPEHHPPAGERLSRLPGVGSSTQ